MKMIKRHRILVLAIAVPLTLIVASAINRFPIRITEPSEQLQSHPIAHNRSPIENSQAVIRAGHTRSFLENSPNLSRLSASDTLKQQGVEKVGRNPEASDIDRAKSEAEVFVNPQTLPTRAVTSSDTRRAMQNDENERIAQSSTQEGNRQSNQQSGQVRGDGEKTKRKPKEERLNRAHPFNGDLRALPRHKPAKRERPEIEEPEPNPTFAPGTAATAQSAPLLDGPGGFAVGGPSAPAPPPVNVFEGLDRFNWGAGSPPDTNGDAGTDYYIQTVNTSIGVYRKSDGLQEAAFTFDTFMSQGSFGNLCDNHNFGDAVVLYDTFEDRWIISDFAFLTDSSGNVLAPAFQCFAASRTGNPLTGGWNFYSIQISDNLDDYPKLGIWPDGLYMSANLFSFGAGSAFQGARVWALNKAQMYAGAPSVQSVSFNAPAADFTIVPSNARLQTGTPPPGTPNYFLSSWNFTNALSIYKFHVDWNSISLSTFTGPDVPTAATSWPNANVANVAQPGTATLLDALQIRAMVQNQYTNISGTESLWATHTVRRANTSGFAAPRWYQVNVSGGIVAPTLPQAATWDPDGANVINRFMPSLAIDRAGNMALGYSASSSTTFPSIKYAGRLATDPANTFGLTEQTLFTGTASQTGSTRWGDYSSMTLDPDGCTFWYTNEYANPADQTFDHRWMTKFGSFKIAACTPVGAGGTVSGTVIDSASSNPINGATVALGSRTTTTNSSGVYTFSDLPAGTYPIITASFAGYASSTTTSIVVTDGGTATQNFALGAATASSCAADTSQSDFQTGVLTNVDLTTSPGDITLSRSSLDQKNTTIGTSGVGITTTTYGGQTFTPAVSGNLTKVDINLFCSGCTGTTPNLTLSIRNTSGSLPTGADIASATITGFSNGGAASYFTATFASPPTLNAGTQYAIVIRPTANPSPGTYALTRSGTSTAGADVYSGGTRVSGATSGTVWSIPLTGGVNTDTGFRVYINSGYLASGNLVSGVRDANPAAGFSPRWLTLSWTATTPANTTLQFQAAASDSVNGPFNFVGPDGTASTFFISSGALLSQFNGFRYLKYEALLSTTDSSVTPTVNDVTACFDTDTPAITAAASISSQQASAAVNSQIANVTDPGQAANTLTVTATPLTGTGVSINNISVDVSGHVTADVASSCGATNSTFRLTVTNNSSATATDTLSVNVTASSTPTITPGGPTTFCASGSVTLTSSNASGDQWYLNGNPIGGATNQAYVATASGNYTVTANGCTSNPSAATTVTVNPAPATPTITPGGPTTFCEGGTVTLTSSNASGNQWFLNGNPIGGETNQSYNANATGDYTVTVTTTGCSSAPSARVTVTVDPIPVAPTITPSGSTQFCSGGITLTSSSASGNQWYLNGNPIGGATDQNYLATAAGDYTDIVTTNSCSSAASAPTSVTAGSTSPLVTTNADNGPGSLREAIQSACPGSTITFDPALTLNGPATIELTSSELVIDKNLTITGPGANVLSIMRSSISGTPNFRLFNITFGGTVSISGLTLSNGVGTNGSNSSSDGGGVYNQGNLTLKNMMFTGNSAETGGAISNFNGALTIISSTISNNHADTGSGGGIESSADLTVVDSTINGNTALRNAGVELNGGSASFINSTFSGNSAVTDGGAFGNGGRPATLTNVTITNNDCDSQDNGRGNGGGIAASAGITLSNTIVAGNFKGSGTFAADDISSVVDSGSFNLIGAGGSGGLTNTNGNQVGVANALLGALANNGGATQTHLLLPGSPAINSGSNALLTSDAFDLNENNDVTEALPVDQRGPGFARVMNSTVDIGAVETNYSISATAGTPQSTINNTGFATALVATVTESSRNQTGIPVTFTPPLPNAGSASGAFSAAAIINTDSNGAATAPAFTANGVSGSYDVVASIGRGMPTASFTLTNSKGIQTITFAAIGNKMFGDADFVISATSDSGLPIALAASGNCTVTPLSPGTVHLTGPGACTITASQDGDTNYEPATSVPQNFTIGRSNQTITFSALAGKKFGDADFPVSASATSGLAVNFSANGQCTMTGTTVHLTSVGTCTIMAAQNGDINYSPAVNVPQSFTIAKLDQTITFGPLANKNFGDADFTVSASTTSQLAVSFSASGQCTIAGTTIHLTGPGSCTVIASQAGDSNFNSAADLPQSFNIARSNQTITFGVLMNKTFGNADFGVNAAASSGLAVSFSANGQCTMTGATVHLISAGSCTITASQAGDTNFNAATDSPQSFTIAKSNQTITFSAFMNKTFGDADFAVNAAASSGLSVSFSAAGQCTIAGTTIHLTGAGSCTITASQAGDANSNAAADLSQSFTIGRSNQTLTFGALGNKTFGDPDFTVSATTTSGLAVTLSANGQCTIGSSTVHITGAGSCTITASLAGDANYDAPMTAMQSFMIAKSNQTISFGALPSRTLGEQDFAVSATASSGLPVDFSASGQCTINDPMVHVTNAGWCTLTATQAGNSNFNAATDASQRFAIGNEESTALVSFSQSNYSVDESAGTITLTVNRTGDLSAPVTVDYATDDTGSSSVCGVLNSGLASSRCDFGLTAGTLTFAATEAQKTFIIPITQDSMTEGPELFTIHLSKLNGSGIALATPASATVTINDSVVAAPNESDDTDAFVRQQYRDFLNRDADPAGLAFWKDNIDKCYDPARLPSGLTVDQCVDSMRVKTSAAFFLSIEFQTTGNLVRGFYVAALDRPLTNNMPAFVEFDRDTQAMQKDVVVGQANWQQNLNNNRDAFMKDFVMRAEFVGLYPTLDTPAQYVDKLYLHAGITPTTNERASAIAEFGTATAAADSEARGRALLDITQSDGFQSREMNRSFVQMEYFGYLRRNPNDAPDGNFAGYDFWLSKLNASGGDFTTCEMVKAFLNSSEYRARFGQ